MLPGDSLFLTVESTQRFLELRLEDARRPHREPGPRDGHAGTDAFLAATSRHLAAVEAVLVPAARRVLLHSDVTVKHYLTAARRLERTLALVKARLYGEAHAVTLSWPGLWSLVARQLAEHNVLESELVQLLTEYDDPDHLDGLARRIFDAETRGPTRPHPYLPHTGPWGLVARRLWAMADRFWDAAEGRTIPQPVRPLPRRHDSLLWQYLVADPRFDATATLLQRRERARRTATTGGPAGRRP
jgi:hypothetical protein